MKENGPFQGHNVLKEKFHCLTLMVSTLHVCSEFRLNAIY